MTRSVHQYKAGRRGMVVPGHNLGQGDIVHRCTHYLGGNWYRPRSSPCPHRVEGYNQAQYTGADRVRQHRSRRRNSYDWVRSYWIRRRDRYTSPRCTLDRSGKALQHSLVQVDTDHRCIQIPPDSPSGLGIREMTVRRPTKVGWRTAELSLFGFVEYSLRLQYSEFYSFILTFPTGRKVRIPWLG